MESARLEAFLARIVPGYQGLVDCERLTGGASRETYRVTVETTNGGKTFALRRALGEDDKAFLGNGPGLTAEPILFRAAHEVGVPGPGVVGVLEPGDVLGVGFLMDWVEGETLGGRIARGEAYDGARRNLARQCGEALARIHSVDVRSSGLEPYLKTAAPADLIMKTHEDYRRLNEPQPMIDYTARWLLANLPLERPPALTHGDFRNGNLMVSSEVGLCAVLDWELSHMGDPMRDLGWLCTRSWRFGGDGPVGGFGTYEDLFAGYESISGEPVNRDAVRFWEVFGSWWWSIGCLTMAQSWRENPQAAGVERPVIGRRSSECQIDCVNMIIPGPAQIPQESDGAIGEAGLPTARELKESAEDFLRRHPEPETGRERFLTRVAENAMAIVEREQRFGSSVAQREAAAISDLLGEEGSPPVLRRALCDGLWSGEIELEREDLQQLLRDRVLAQVLIDQPEYPGAIEAQAAN